MTSKTMPEQTMEEKAKIVDILKFEPCTYKVRLWGYGGEKVMGTVNQEDWDYCMENQVDLQDIAWNYDVEEMGLDPEKLPFPPGSWYECDDMAHVNGVARDSGTLQIEDENGKQMLRRIDPKDILAESAEEPVDVTFSSAIHVEAKPAHMQHT